MKKQNITVKAMADAVGVSEQDIRNLMSAKASPMIAQIRLICKTLGVTANYMLGIDDEFWNKISQ